MNTDEYKSIQVGQVLMYKTERVQYLYLTKSYYKYHSRTMDHDMFGWETTACKLMATYSNFKAHSKCANSDFDLLSAPELALAPMDVYDDR